MLSGLLSVTGSGVAGAAGLAIVADVVHERAHIWRPYGFRVSTHCLTMTPWIDYVFAFGGSSFATVSILDDFADFLA